MTEIQNIKPVLVIEKLRFEIYLACDELSRVEFGAWNLEFYVLSFGILQIHLDCIWALRQSQYVSKIKYIQRYSWLDFSKKLHFSCCLGSSAVQIDMLSILQ
jgi:hypothetical protein